MQYSVPSITPHAIRRRLSGKLFDPEQSRDSRQVFGANQMGDYTVYCQRCISTTLKQHQFPCVCKYGVHELSRKPYNYIALVVF